MDNILVSYFYYLIPIVMISVLFGYITMKIAKEKGGSSINGFVSGFTFWLFGFFYFLLIPNKSKSDKNSLKENKSDDAFVKLVELKNSGDITDEEFKKAVAKNIKKS